MSYPHNQPGHFYPALAPRPNNATTVLAAIFGLCLGVWFTLGTLASYQLASDSILGTETHLIYRPLAALLLVLGGILLLRRLTVGRVFVIVGVLGAFADGFADLSEYRPHGFADMVFPLAFFSFYLAIIVLAAHPSTTRWIRTRP
ncbi:hypothetical protein GPX89_20720 [Nocardia sp. ET3-3]|uniref:Uncharacterized protein n=1 Tax=Nocardia terrae TaxID=2675851 RepID=A0A7K1UZF7_9NOCA|nr:hypothetical protein [Nocardia terrae]MVU79657.1 hypothetical protein [Nocardia terrae]